MNSRVSPLSTVRKSSRLAVFASKCVFSVLGNTLGPRRVFDWIFPSPPNLNYYDSRKYPGVEGKVAVTIDDAFCRSDDPDDSFIEKVTTICAKHEHKITFFLTSNFCKTEWKKDAIRKVVAQGHELANHAVEDTTYSKYSFENFAKVVDETNDLIAELQSHKVGETLSSTNSTVSSSRENRNFTRWFRAPNGKQTRIMTEVLRSRSMTNVMGDCYANDWFIDDPAWCARTITRSIRSGSIVILHMPEKGFREWTLEELRLVLQELNIKGFKSVTLSELHIASERKD